MKLVLVALFAALAFAGCTNLRLASIPRPDGPYAPAIYAAGSVAFSPDRAATLKEIAAKPDLSEAEQIYLVEVLAASGGFSSDRRDVLLSLLHNGAVTLPTKRRISDVLPDLGLFSGDAKAVADALAG